MAYWRNLLGKLQKRNIRLTGASASGLLFLLDVAIVATSAGLLHAREEFYMILMFFLLTLGAFFWKPWGFIIRTVFWVLVANIIIIVEVAHGGLPFEEIGDAPLLTAILVMVFVITQQRKRAEASLKDTNLHLEQRVSERTAALSISNQKLLDEIARRKKTELALWQSEANLRAIIDNTLQAFVLVDEDGIVQAFNKLAWQGVAQIFGNDLTMGVSLPKILPETIAAAFNADLKRACDGTLVRREESIHFDGREMWVELTYTPVFAETGTVMGICLGATNIDARKHAVDKLTESESRWLAEMQSLLAITHVLLSEVNLNTLLDFIATQAKYLTYSNGVNVLLLSEDKQFLQMARKNPDDTQNRRIPVEGTLAGQAISTRSVQISNHVSPGDPTTAELCAILYPARVASLLCAPLIERENTLGVLVAWHETTATFNEHDGRLMYLFANQAALALQNAQLHKKNRQLAVEQERHRLARELHDTVTQLLYSISMVVQVALKLMEEPDATAKLHAPLSLISTMAKEALTEMRAQIFQLTSIAEAEGGLIPALQSHCTSLEKRYGLAITMRVTPPHVTETLPTEQMEALYYITREALWNVVKHASARDVSIVLEKTDGHLQLSVTDDGIGFDPLAQLLKNSMGLKNMKERAEEIGGAFTVAAAPGNGCTITVRM